MLISFLVKEKEERKERKEKRGEDKEKGLKAILMRTGVGKGGEKKRREGGWNADGMRVYG